MRVSRACVVVAIVVAVLGVHEVEAGQEESCAAWAARNPRATRLDAVLLFEHDGGDATRELFRNRRIAVAGLGTMLGSDADGWRVRLDYTSFNFGPEGRDTDVIYPHEATILAGGSRSLPPDREPGYVLVLEVQEDAAFTYSWVGCALPSEGVALDWFADRPELRYRDPGEDGAVIPPATRVTTRKLLGRSGSAIGAGARAGRRHLGDTTGSR